MHIELVVPALLGAAHARRSALPAHSSPACPALELLLARGRRRDATPASLEAWLGHAFGLEDEAIPAGALTALAGNEEPGTQFWLRADPVHLRADRDRLLLMPNEGFSLSMDEAQALALALEPLLRDRFTLHPVQAGKWCLRGEDAEGTGSRAPIELAGADVDANLPERRWHPLLTEIQMALYDHAVNTAREARGEPVINSLWLWGGGRLPAAASGPWHSVSADDPLALGLARLAQLRHRAPGAGAAEWLERAPEDGRHLVVLDRLRGAAAFGDAEAYAQRLGALEASWFAPLLAALRSGRAGMVSVHVPEAGASVETARADLRRFWRRPRPLATWAAA